jgi:hypothetical protein
VVLGGVVDNVWDGPRVAHKSLRPWEDVVKATVLLTRAEVAHAVSQAPSVLRRPAMRVRVVEVALDDVLPSGAPVRVAVNDVVAGLGGDRL